MTTAAITPSIASFEVKALENLKVGSDSIDKQKEVETRTNGAARENFQAPKPESDSSALSEKVRKLEQENSDLMSKLAMYNEISMCILSDNSIHVPAPDGSLVPVTKPVMKRYVDPYAENNGGDVTTYEISPRIIPAHKEYRFVKENTLWKLSGQYDDANWRVATDKFDYSKRGFILIGDIWVNPKSIDVVKQAREVANYKPVCACVIL